MLQQPLMVTQATVSSSFRPVCFPTSIALPSPRKADDRCHSHVPIADSLGTCQIWFMKLLIAPDLLEANSTILLKIGIMLKLDDLKF